MKNTILPLTLLLLPLCANSQSATTDSSVTIPLRWMRKAVADLRRFDDCKAEMALLKPRIETQGRLLGLLAKDTAAKAERIDFLNAQVQSEKLLSATLETNCNEQLQRYATEAKKAKRRSRLETVLVAVGAAATGFFIHSLVR